MAAIPTLFKRPAKIDWDRHEARLGEARANLDAAIIAQQAAAMAVELEEPGSPERHAKALQHVQDARAALAMLEDAGEGFRRLQADQDAAAIQKAQADMDRKAQAAFSAVVQSGNEVEQAVAALATAYGKLVASFNAAQAQFPGNPHLRESARYALSVVEVVVTELTRASPREATTMNAAFFLPGARAAMEVGDTADRRRWPSISQVLRDWTRTAWTKAA